MLAVVVAHVAPAAANPPTTFNPVVEAQNFSITQQRQTIYDTPQYQAAARGRQRLQHRPGAGHRGRRSRALLHRRPVLEPLERVRRRHPPEQLGDATATGSCGRSCSPRATAPRSPATCGRPWPGRQSGPGIVITDGSVQADENMYWYAAQALAKAGYVVLTFDPQGQGQSRHVRSVPRPERGRPGADRRTPFYDGTEDAIDFLLSTPPAPVRAGAQLLHRDEPRRQAERARGRRPGRGLQPVLAAARSVRGRPRRPLLRRRRRLVHRPVGSAREGDRGLGRPRRPRSERRRPCRAPRRGRRRRRSARRHARPTRPTGRRSRSPSRRWACPPTTGSRRRRTPRCPTRTPSRRGR